MSFLHKLTNGLRLNHNNHHFWIYYYCNVISKVQIIKKKEKKKKLNLALNRRGLFEDDTSCQHNQPQAEANFMKSYRVDVYVAFFIIEPDIIFDAAVSGARI